MGIAAYNEFLLDRAGAYRRPDQRIGVIQNLFAAAGLLWVDNKDTSEQRKGQQKGKVNHMFLF